MFNSPTNPNDTTYPHQWSQLKCGWDSDHFFEELYDLAPKDSNGNAEPLDLKTLTFAHNKQKDAHVFIKQITSKIISQLQNTSRKLEFRSRVEEASLPCVHEFHGSTAIFVDNVMNALKSYINYAHEYSNESMLAKHYEAQYNQDINYCSKSCKNKRKRKQLLNKIKKHKSDLHLKKIEEKKKKGENPLHFKQIYFGPSTSFTICSHCVLLFFIKSRKLRTLLGFIHSALRSQYIEFEYVLNTITWFTCKILLHPLIRKTVFNDNFMRDYFLEIWHKLWRDNKYYYLVHHDTKVINNENKHSYPTNVFINILPTMFYNFNYILTMTLVNFKYNDIENKLVQNNKYHWQRILAFNVQQADLAYNGYQRFMDQDEDMFYNLGNIVNEWVFKYKSCDHWFNMKGKQNETIAHYQIINLQRVYDQRMLKIIRNRENEDEFTEKKSPLPDIKCMSNVEKSCINCKKSGLWFDKENNAMRHRKLFICAGCRNVYYCSRKCQKYDWSRGKHKILCRALKIEYSTYLVYDKN